jgi:hypothetical protein
MSCSCWTVTISWKQRTWTQNAYTYFPQILDRLTRMAVLLCACFEEYQIPFSADLPTNFTEVPRGKFRMAPQRDMIASFQILMLHSWRPPHPIKHCVTNAARTCRKVTYDSGVDLPERETDHGLPSTEPPALRKYPRSYRIFDLFWENSINLFMSLALLQQFIPYICRSCHFYSTCLHRKRNSCEQKCISSVSNAEDHLAKRKSPEGSPAFAQRLSYCTASYKSFETVLWVIVLQHKYL